MTKKKTAEWLENKSWHRIRNEMLLSPAWKAASHLQRSMVFALLSELGRHSGKNNGHLIFTNSNWEEFGLSRRIIKPNLAALSALGFISFKTGRPGLKGFGKARRYRITFLPTLDADGNEIEPPTDEWARFNTTEEAKMAAKEARKRLQVPKTGVQSAPLYSGVQSAPLSQNPQLKVARETPRNIESECEKGHHYLHLANHSPPTAQPGEGMRWARTVRADSRGLRVAWVRVAAEALGMAA